MTAIRALCRVVMHLFFSSTRVIGAERVPTSGPVLYVANHHSSLVDPVALIASMPRSPRFLAKAVLWERRYLPLRPFLAAAGAIPVHRVKDGGGDNAAMFRECHRVLEADGVIGLFGEGASHDLPGLLEMKTGAARIALGSDAEITVVPVGLVYDDRARFRSRAIASIGAPITVAGSTGGADDRDAVRNLTARIGDALGDVAPTFATWERHDDINVAARVLVAEDAARSFEDTLVGLTAAADGPGGADVVGDLRIAVHELEREAARHGLDIDTVVDQPRRRVGGLAWRSALKTAVWALPVWLGRVLNWPPFTLVGRMANRHDLNFQATFKIIAGLFAYPAWWVVLAIAGAVVIHPTATVLIVVAPVSGYLSARYSARFRRLRNRREVNELGVANDLESLRTDVADRAGALIAAA